MPEWNTFQVLKGRLLTLPTKCYCRLERLARNKHSSIILIMAVKSFITLGLGHSTVSIDWAENENKGQTL
jgi:hypothetical protein